MDFSYVLAAGGILGIWLAGRKNLWGWALGLSMQVLWVGFAIVTAQYGFLLSAAGYGWVYWHNWSKWRREQRAEAEGLEVLARRVNARYRTEGQIESTVEHLRARRLRERGAR